MNGRAAARSGEWAQHFSNASCSLNDCIRTRAVYRVTAKRNNRKCGTTQCDSPQHSFERRNRLNNIWHSLTFVNFFVCFRKLAQRFSDRSITFIPFHSPMSFLVSTSGSAIAAGPRDVLVSRNSATTKYRYRVALFA